MNSITSVSSRNSSEYPIEPQDIEAEQALLGSLLMDRDAIIHVAPLLKASDFYDPRHQIIYSAIVELYESRRPADLVLLRDLLTRNEKLERCGGIAYITELYRAEMTPVHANYYAAIVAEMAVRRRHIGLGGEVARLAWDTSRPIADMLAAVNDVTGAASLESISDDYIDLSLAVTRTMDELQNPSKIPAVRTGYVDLDEWVGGFKPGQFVVIAARTGRGKTAFAVGMLHHHCIKKGRKAGLLSLEMPYQDIAKRLLAIQSQLDSHRLTTGTASFEDEQRRSEAAGMMSNLKGNLLIVEKKQTEWSLVAAQIRDMAARFGVELVVVDYLQLLRSSKSDNRVQELAEITRGMKLLAMDLKIPIVALAQLSRSIEQRGDDSRPRLSDLRESGSIEQDADIVIFIHHKEKNGNGETLPEALFIVEKNREGPTAVLTVQWHAPTAEFRSIGKRTGY